MRITTVHRATGYLMLVAHNAGSKSAMEGVIGCDVCDVLVPNSGKKRHRGREEERVRFEDVTNVTRLSCGVVRVSLGATP